MLWAALCTGYDACVCICICSVNIAEVGQKRWGLKNKKIKIKKGSEIKYNILYSIIQLTVIIEIVTVIAIVVVVSAQIEMRQRIHFQILMNN